MITEQSIREAYSFLRANTSVDEETLDFMLDSSLRALKGLHEMSPEEKALREESDRLAQETSAYLRSFCDSLK